jgi:citrate lyase beta subunit
MDFCKSFGLRRTINQPIYEIGVVRDVLSDILTVFSDDYVVSAPVWEYFDDKSGNEDWALGMERELQLDVANGFVGKTVIHPSQIPLVKKWLQPTVTDVADAKAILNWKDDAFGVAKSVKGNRMNELATHKKWAQKILILSEIYGERSDEYR